MKIKKLTITNLASIASAELDFTGGALGEDPLFLICGDTGAGKTTILDAICLALYGLTPRYTASKRMGVDIGGFKSDDVRQLVRHGATTASAVLTLEGNDGRNYEASWIVDARVKGQNKGTLKEAEWVWKDVTGNQTYAQKSECEEVVQRAVGLDFGQFCRTTLLAQGQFTKFLLGADEEKAKILEKLTDTSRYSDLGKKIKSAFKSAEDEVKDLKRKIEALAGMSDEERAAAEQERTDLDKAVKAAAEEAAAAKVQADWLKRLAQLETSVRNATGALTTAYASLKASTRQKREVLGETEGAYATACAALEKEVARKGLYEAADVVVSNLRDVRQAEKEKAQAENERDELAAAQPEFEARVQQAERAQEEAERAAFGKRKQIDDAVAELEKMELGRLRQEKEGLVKKSGDLGRILLQMAENDRRQGALETLRLELKSRQDEHDARKAELPKLAADRDDAKARWEQACAERKVQKNLIDDGIKRIVAGLKTGDTCPICGNRIDELHGEAYFTEIITRLNKTCDTAEKAFRERESASNQAVARVDALAKALAGEARRIDQEETVLRTADAALQETARGFGIAELTRDAVASARAACDARMDELADLIRDGEAKEGEIKSLRAEGQKLNDAFLRAKDALARARQALQDCVQKQDAKQEAIVAADARAREKFAAAAEKFVRAGWEAAWRADAEGFERQLQKSAQAYRTQQDQKQKLEHAVETLRQSCGQMADCLARAEAQEPTLADVAADAHAAGNGTAEVDARLGQLAAVKGERAEHESNRPAALAATDTEESLRRAAAERQAACDDLQKRKGALEQRLKDDATRGTERARLQLTLVTAQETLDEWKPLYDEFGDEDGKKVRLAIQAYVLKNVLVKANAVLARLADRYELSCEGLTLTVRDAYEGGVERPVNTLSGGEGFLVSLALALGLAGVNERKLGVDMLFIDEGFGTLSGEHLDRAVESLESLNALCGCRKVGVISHVERLREKIRTHVEVTREGHDPSVVRVVAAR